MSEFNKIKVGIIDLEINNIYSIFNAFKKIGYNTSIIKNKFKNYDFIVLPGVGSFKEGMKSLKKKSLANELKESVLIKKKKLIGICLGMQLLFSDSEEFGKTNGLGLISGKVKKFKKKNNFSIPVIGWYKTSSFKKKLKNKYFYHIHSYYCEPEEKSSILSTTEYEKFNYCSSVHKENILAFQFHPEKSGENGISLLKVIPLYFK